MGDSLRAAILGIVEGLTEFLPVSSTGHMILAMPLLGVDGASDPWPSFLYFIQIGAIFAVILYFLPALVRQIATRPAGGVGDHLLTKLLVAMAPSAVIGLSFDDVAEKYLERPVPVAAALIVGGGVMIWIERRYRKTTGPSIEQVTLRQAFFVGLAQCVAIIPGTSRAMATIMGGLVVGMPGATAAEFSFYLAIPTLCGAGLLRIVKHREALTGDHLETMAVGFMLSFLVAWAVVAAFMKYIRTRPLWPFAVYRIGLGVVVLAWLALRAG